MPKTELSPLEKKYGAKLNRSRLTKKLKLPASFDLCMAYFTGYLASPLTITNMSEFIELSSKCISYCEAMHDKDTLQLLMYAIMRRVYPNGVYMSIDDSFPTLLVNIIHDTAHLYENNKQLQVQHMAYVFRGFLSIIKEKEFDFSKIDRPPSTPQSRESIQRWHQKFQIGANRPHVFFSRGGGLYHFVDLLKGINPGRLDDSGKVRAVYVTPDTTTTEEAQKQEREIDRLYALHFGKGLIRLDVPSVQTGTIPCQLLFSTNSNDYEALICVEDLPKVKGLRINELPFSKSRNNPVIFTDQARVIETYLDQTEKTSLGAIRILLAILDVNASKNNFPPIDLTSDDGKYLLKTAIESPELLDDELTKWGIKNTVSSQSPH